MRNRFFSPRKSSLAFPLPADSHGSGLNTKKWADSFPTASVERSFLAPPPLNQWDETVFSQLRASNEGLLRLRILTPTPHSKEGGVIVFYCAR
jgi:hypothetical protein